MKGFVGSRTMICCTVFISANVETSWLIDTQRFHISVHGQLSCQDRHGGIIEKQPYPNPLDVNKSLKDFFRLEQCPVCHEDVLEDVNEGEHGGDKIRDRHEFYHCIGCHDPHYQLSYSESEVSSL